MKKPLYLLTALVLMLSLLAACGNNETNDPSNSPDTSGQPSESQPAQVNLWDGYYTDESTGMLSFVRLNEDGTYYAKYFDGGVMDAGLWELVEEATTYQVSFESTETKDSTQTIILTSYSTGTPVRVAYVDDQLCDMSLGGMANHRTLEHKADYAYDPAVDEVAIQLYVFYANNDIGANFILNHDRTFEDVTGDTFASGKWEMNGTGEYKLTYDGGDTASLTVDPSGKSAVLTKADNTTVELKDDYREGDDSAVQVMNLRAEEVEVGLPMKVNLRIDGYKDGSCKLIVEVAQVGAELLADEGTFEVSEAMKPTFHFNLAGDIEGEPDYAGATESGIPFNVTYTGSVEPEFNGANTPMAIDSAFTGTYNPNASAGTAEPVVVTTMRCEDAQVGLPMGVALRLDCYDDGTCKLIVEVAQIGAELEADKGTYAVSETMKYTFTFDKAGEVTGEPDYATATENGVDINMAYAADVEVEFNGANTPLSIDSTLTGTHSA